MKEPGEKTGVLVGLDLPYRVGEQKQGSYPHIRAIVWVRGETFKAESETAGLWLPKHRESDSPCSSHTYPRQGPQEGAAAGSWRLGAWSDPRVSAAVDCRDRPRGGEGGAWWETPVQESRAGGSKAILLSHTAEVEPSPQPLSPPQASTSSWTLERLARQTPEAPNYRAGPHPGCPVKCLTRGSTE